MAYILLGTWTLDHVYHIFGRTGHKRFDIVRSVSDRGLKGFTLSPSKGIEFTNVTPTTREGTLQRLKKSRPSGWIY